MLPGTVRRGTLGDRHLATAGLVRAAVHLAFAKRHRGSPLATSDNGEKVEPAPRVKVQEHHERDNERMKTVGQAAHASGLTPKAVRLYEQRGLLTPIERSHAGYRQYTDDDLARLVFIRQARSLGLHLDDIAAVIAAASGDDPPCATVRGLLDDRIADIDQMIGELTNLRTALTAARKGTPSGQARLCPMIEAAAR